MSVKIRKMAEKDLRALAKLNASLFSDTSERRALEVFRDCLKNQVPGACLLAEENGEIVGGVFTAKVVSFAPKSAMVKSLFLKKSCRGKGVGKALLEKCIEAAKKAGIGDISLTVKGNNKRALALYKKLGFKPFRLLLLKRL